jgi:hypothetical protein
MSAPLLANVLEKSPERCRAVGTVEMVDAG